MNLSKKVKISKLRKWVESYLNANQKDSKDVMYFNEIKAVPTGDKVKIRIVTTVTLLDVISPIRKHTEFNMLVEKGGVNTSDLHTHLASFVKTTLDMIEDRKAKELVN